MKTLIFEPTLSGHHLEYLHHYYLGALERPENEYIFLVPKSFDQVQEKYEWEKANNIKITYIDEKHIARLSSSNIYILGWNVSRTLNHYIRRLHPDEVILTMLMQFIPFIIFLFPSNVRIRGIMYKIYLYEQERMTKLRLFIERARFWLASRAKIIETIFVLNDSDSAEKFNKIYNTQKFRFLSDPVPSINVNQVQDIRMELNIPQNHKIYLHFGSLDKRKGTIDILRAIINSSAEQLQNKTFIFAGKLNAKLKEEFYQLLEQAYKKVTIFVYDEFCSYDFLYDLCKTCDVILMPYHVTNLSSGVIGYAALFEKPVIGPSKGLLGHLIKKYELGKTIEPPISPTFLDIDLCIPSKSNLYIKENSLTNFMKLVMK